MLTPKQYIESLYENQGFKVVCTSVELELSDSTVEGKELEGMFRLATRLDPDKLVNLNGFVFGNYYRETTAAGVVDFFFFLKPSDTAHGLLQSFAAQFSKGA